MNGTVEQIWPRILCSSGEWMPTDDDSSHVSDLWVKIGGRQPMAL